MIATPGITPSITVEQAVEAIARISALAAQGQIGLDEANDDIIQKSFVEAKTSGDVEARLAAIEQMLRDRSAVHTVDVTVTDGLPVPPGFEGVKMPPRTIAAPTQPGGNGKRDREPE